MARKIIKIRYLSDISSVGELREARRELELRTWYAERKLEDDIEETFTLDNMLSIFAPPGSLPDRILCGIGTGVATIRGIGNAFRMFRGRGRDCDCGCGC
jgi:hypothetical protein